MEEFFSEQTYYAFPSIQAALFALLLSFTLSTIIAFVYRYTYRGVQYSKELFQAVVLISIIAATIMMAIGDSLARGLGILGALAIIRFRYRFDNPKNIVYIFASLAIGIGCGVYGFAIAVAGTAVFSLISFALYLSPLGKTEFYEWGLSFVLTENGNIEEIETYLEKNCEDFKLTALGDGAGGQKYEYQVSLKSSVSDREFFKGLSAMPNVENVRINSRGSVDRI